MPPRLLPVELNSYKPLREIVLETLRQAITDHILKPGERLMEVQLAEELGVSRTPVREAIRQLELEGFVVMIPRKGAYVADLTNKDVAEVMEIRAALEGLAASLAAERISAEELEQLERLLVDVAEIVKTQDVKLLVEADTKFHDVIYQASRNTRLVQIVSNLREQIQRFRTTSLAYPGRMRHTLEEHKKIVDAIARGDVKRARIMAIDHIENAENKIMEAMARENKEDQAQTGGE